MSEAATTTAPAPAGESQPVVSARDLTRRYGEGDTAVDALRGVDLDVRRGQLTAVMGPSGSGKSTLMHILAGLDRPTTGDVTIAGTSLTSLNDTELTKLRRKHIGFVFQFFNLLPMLNAEENVVLPALDRRREARQGVGRRACSNRSACRTGATTARRSSPAGSSSASRSAVRSSTSRRSSSPTSRPATSTRRRAARSSSCSSARFASSTRRSSWSRTRRAQRRSPTASSSSTTA